MNQEEQAAFDAMRLRAETAEKRLLETILRDKVAIAKHDADVVLYHITKELPGVAICATYEELQEKEIDLADEVRSALWEAGREGREFKRQLDNANDLIKRLEGTMSQSVSAKTTLHAPKGGGVFDVRLSWSLTEGVKLNVTPQVPPGT